MITLAEKYNSFNLKRSDPRFGPGVYLIYQAAKLIYVGSTSNLFARVSLAYWKLDETHSFELIPTKSKKEALELETRIFRDEKPPNNIRPPIKELDGKRYCISCKSWLLPQDFPQRKSRNTACTVCARSRSQAIYKAKQQTQGWL